MSINPTRGVKFGGLTAICFAVITPINNLLRQEPVSIGAIVTGSIFALLLFGLIGTFTNKLGSDVGDA